MLKRNSINVYSNARPQFALQKWEPAGRIGDFGIFLTVSLKAYACFDRPEYWMSAICIAKL